MIMKVINVHVRNLEKEVYKRPKEKMKITHKGTFLREKGSPCRFNINSFAFSLTGKALTVPHRPLGILEYHSPLPGPGDGVGAASTLPI